MMYPATHTQLSENVCTVKCDIYTRIYSMEQSPWEANHFAASQQIPGILWNPKVHYCIHKCQLPVSILSQLDLVCTPTSWRSILLPTHLILDFITRTILGEEYITLSSSLCSFLHCTVISSFLGPNTLLNTLFSLTHKTHTTSLPECCEVRKRSIVMAFQLEGCGYKDEACWWQFVK